MVVKRTCSFCAGEIEPGTGTMYIKRDGAVFHFCCSSCRKQQLHLGRVGHRLKWTRAHALRRQTEQSSAAGKLAAEAKGKATAPGVRPKRAIRPTEVPTPTPPVAPPATEAVTAAEPDASSSKEPPASSAPAAAAKKPRAKKPKDSPSP